MRGLSKERAVAFGRRLSPHAEQRRGTGGSSGHAGDLWARRKTRVFFDDQDLDVYLSFTLARAASRGASLGESIRAASQVDPTRPTTWATAWTAAANGAERQAGSLAGLDPVGERDAWLRAASYHRAAMFGQGVRDALGSHEATVAAFRRAACGHSAVEPMDVHWGGWRSPGYFVRASAGPEPRPTILLFLGGETLAEDVWAWIGEAAARRGWNTFVAEPPSFFGFRAANPAYPAVTWATIEPFLRPYVDAAMSQACVDPDRLVAAGFSGGGHLAIRAAATDRRLSALVADAPILDFDRLATAEFPPALLKAPPAMLDVVLKATAARSPFLAVTLEKLKWQFGVQKLHEFFAAFTGTTNADVITDLQVPFLALTGEGESPEQRRQAQDAFAMAGEPKAFRLFTASEGAEAHTQVNHPALMQETIFAWLADVLPR